MVELSRTPEWCGAAGEVVDLDETIAKEKGEVPAHEVIDPVDELDRSRKAQELAAAGDPRPMRESLETARKLLRCGNLLDATVGVVISAEACECARDERTPVLEELEANALEVTDILPILAREVVHTYNMFDGLAFEPLSESGYAPEESLIPIFDPDRERALYKQYYADGFHKAKRYMDDPDKLYEVLWAHRPSDELRSITMDGVSFGMFKAIPSMAEDIRRYRECVEDVRENLEQ